MIEAEPITDPSLLQESDIIIRLSNLCIEISKSSSELSSQKQQAKLVLLQPLTNADTLEACRNPNLCSVHNSEGLTTRTSNHEYLNIQPLSQAWRQALMKVPPIPYLTFDLTLPKEDEKNKESFQRVYWDTAMPKGTGLGIHLRDVMTLVITIATGIRMRADGDVRFEVTYVEAEVASCKGMAALKKQLLALAETKPPRIKDEERNAEENIE